MRELTPIAFTLFLSQFDADPEKAGAIYNTLHFKLQKYFNNQDRGRYNTDHAKMADQTINRVARKLAKGIAIEKNIFAFVHGTARLVWLEFLPKPDFVIDPADAPDRAAPEFVEEIEDERMACLRSCLVGMTKDDNERRVLLDYYGAEPDEKNKERRKSIAERLGITMGNLKTKMSRLRDKLEKCVAECVRKQKAKM